MIPRPRSSPRGPHCLRDRRRRLHLARRLTIPTSSPAADARRRGRLRHVRTRRAAGRGLRAPSGCDSVDPESAPRRAGRRCREDEQHRARGAEYKRRAVENGAAHSARAARTDEALRELTSTRADPAARVGWFVALRRVSGACDSVARGRGGVGRAADSRVASAAVQAASRQGLLAAIGRATHLGQRRSPSRRLHTWRMERPGPGSEGERPGLGHSFADRHL
jgi:hypothetical protein